MRSFCKTKNATNKTKQQPTEWEKIFIKTTSNRGLISNMYSTILEKHKAKVQYQKQCNKVRLSHNRISESHKSQQ